MNEPTTHQTTRRSFLKASAFSCLLPASARAWGPPLLNRERPDRILIHVNLQGGSDGLSSLIPYTNDAYYRARPSLAVPKEDVLRLDGELGMPPALEPLRRLYDEGLLALIRGVGSPRSSLSHFRAADVVHSAVPGFGVHRHGWLGRARAFAWGEEECPELFQHLGPEVPKLLRGPAGPVFSYQSPRMGAVPFTTSDAPEGEDSPVIASIRQRMRACNTVLPRVEAAIAGLPGRDKFPDTAFGENLHAIAGMIHAGFPTRVYSITQKSYDSHSPGCGCQDEMLRELALATRELINTLKRSGCDKEVLVLASTEFGRRVHENASGGTDHGAATHWLLLGSSVRGGMHGEHPSLEELDENGNLKPNVDFRAVYAALLDQWFGIESGEVLGERLDAPRLVTG